MRFRSRGCSFARRLFPPAAAARGRLAPFPARDTFITLSGPKSKITNAVVFASFGIRAKRASPPYAHMKKPFRAARPGPVCPGGRLPPGAFALRRGEVPAAGSAFALRCGEVLVPRSAFALCHAKRRGGSDSCTSIPGDRRALSRKFPRNCRPGVLPQKHKKRDRIGKLCQQSSIYRQFFAPVCFIFTLLPLQ